MGDFGYQILAIFAGMAIGIPILLLFRQSGRGRCWRCKVNMLPVAKRSRIFALLPIGRCEGCNIPCFAMGEFYRRKRRRSGSGAD